MPCFKILLILLVVGGLLNNVVLADTTASLRPTADGGNDSDEWKNTSNSACDTVDCYTEVDESSGSSCTNSDGDASYVQVDVNGTNQTFDIDESSIQNNSTITQIDITVCYKSGSPGGDTNDFQTRYCANDSCSNYGMNIATGASYTEITQSHSGLSITKTASTDLEMGIAITGTAGELIRISQISAVITYTPPGEPGEEEEEEPSTSEPGPGEGRRVKVAFSGQAYPGSKIEVLRRGSQDEEARYLTVPLETYLVRDDGTFDLTLGALVSDEYFFALRAEDRDGRKTSIIAFDIDLKTENTLEAKDIFIPPTVELEKTKVARGKEIYIFGYAGPHNVIEAYIDELIMKTAQADENGYWTALISTSVLTARKHSVKVRQVDSSGKLSRFSLFKNFRVSLLQFPQVDFNDDDIINITDWSVFLFRWGQQDESLRTTIDLNSDGKINISDFSMFLNMMKIQ